MDFKIIVDSTLLELWPETGLHPVAKKHVKSLVNDFEDTSWRYQRFQNFIWDNISEAALSHGERQALMAFPMSQLHESAKKLRLTDSDGDVGEGSEIAEIALYGIMKRYFGALSVVPKIFYKQNANDYAKGSDSVHIVLAADGEFSLFLGEAKFYKSVADARLDVVVNSVLTSIATEKLKKENSIITSVSDLDHLDIPDPLRAKIKKALSRDTSIDEIKPKLHVPILLLHECKITASQAEMSESYVEDLKAFHRERAISYFTKQIAKGAVVNKYADVTFHLILFPVPEKKKIVDAFKTEATNLKG